MDALDIEVERRLAAATTPNERALALMWGIMQIFRGFRAELDGAATPTKESQDG